jgi:hypothetical protein
MTSNSPPNEPDVNLSEEEKARIRAEVRYAVIAAKEARPPEKNKSVIGKVLAFFSSGIVLLIVGSFVTSWLVPSIQKQAEIRKEQSELLNKLLEGFILYSNTLQKELYELIPLTQENEMSREQFAAYTKKINDIRLKRIDAYARLNAIAINIDDDNASLSDYKTKITSEQQSDQPEFKCNLDNGKNNEEKVFNLQTAIENYSRKLETKSDCITRWLYAFYCKNLQNRCSSTETMKNPTEDYDKMVKSFESVENADKSIVLSLIKTKIKQYK